MASTKKASRGPGRPQMYPLTSTQVKRIQKLIAGGTSSKEIAEKLDIHPFAVLRVRRAM